MGQKKTEAPVLFCLLYNLLKITTGHINVYLMLIWALLLLKNIYQIVSLCAICYQQQQVSEDLTSSTNLSELGYEMLVNKRI